MSETYHIVVSDELDKRIKNALNVDPSIENKSQFVRSAVRDKLLSMRL